jgi:putative SOS response-associated peptidase YedK
MTLKLMCGRYVFTPDERFYDRFTIENRLDVLDARYNVAPGQNMPVITRNSPNQAVMMRWGLIPFWAKDAKTGWRTINARAESVRVKPAFKKPFQSQRCLIPASGFYEWEKRPHLKVPYYFKLKTNDMFAFAGLYDIWKDGQRSEVKSYTIITTESNSLVGKIHNRMPVILRKADESTWLDKNTNLEIIAKLLKPYKGNDMAAYPVASEANNAKIDVPNLIKPAHPLLKLQ